jgi:transposase
VALVAIAIDGPGRGWIDTHVLPSGATARIENTPEGIARWAASLRDGALFVFEGEAGDGSVRGTEPPPNGGCDGPLIEALAGRGVRFARVNPRQARDFARPLGVLAKTDRVGARILAEMGRMLPPEAPAPPDPDRVRLADFLRRRKQLVEICRTEKVRRHNAGQPAILSEIETMIALLDQRIADIDREIAALIAASPALAEQAQLLSAVPGIDPTVLATLLGELPELGARCRRRIASLAGLAPHARESGTWRIWGGRRKVREALYIATLSASRRLPAVTAMRDRMRAAGKAPKTILIAIARQLLVILNAMIRHREPIRL